MSITDRVQYLNSNLTINFPPGFLWGVATSAYQIEGNLLNSDFINWEKKNNLESSGETCNSWENLDRDLAALIKIKAKCYRFSIEWSRIQPRENYIDQSAIIKYKQFLEKLKQNNIEPIITLHHFSMPKWCPRIDDAKFIPYFLNFTSLIIRHIECRYWITFNEPTLMLMHGYLLGRRPPGYKGEIYKYFQAQKNLCQAHCQVYKLIHSKYPHGLVSMAENYVVFESKSIWNPFNWLMTYISDVFTNTLIYDTISNGIVSHIRKLPGKHLDFIGLNHYNRAVISALGEVKLATYSGYPVSAIEWDVVPDSLSRSIKYMYHRYKLPIFVTENGVADPETNIDDNMRINHLLIAAATIEKLTKEQIPILGYCHWSLMDNFEWEYGRRIRFGLFKTDYDNFKLIPRKSSQYFKRISQQIQ